MAVRSRWGGVGGGKGAGPLLPLLLPLLLDDCRLPSDQSQQQQPGPPSHPSPPHPTSLCPPTRDGSVLVYPLVETIHRDSICYVTEAPADVRPDIAAEARRVAELAIAALDGAGIFGWVPAGPWLPGLRALRSCACGAGESVCATGRVCRCSPWPRGLIQQQPCRAIVARRVLQSQRRLLQPLPEPAGEVWAGADAALTPHPHPPLCPLCSVEMFVLPDGRVLLNEVAPRPHNSGHYTQDGCITSQVCPLANKACRTLPLGRVPLPLPLPRPSARALGNVAHPAAAGPPCGHASQHHPPSLNLHQPHAPARFSLRTTCVPSWAGHWGTPRSTAAQQSCSTSLARLTGRRVGGRGSAAVCCAPCCARAARTDLAAFGVLFGIYLLRERCTGGSVVRCCLASCRLGLSLPLTGPQPCTRLGRRPPPQAALRLHPWVPAPPQASARRTSSCPGLTWSRGQRCTGTASRACAPTARCAGGAAAVAPARCTPGPLRIGLP
jgi:hypothetical protein